MAAPRSDESSLSTLRIVLPAGVYLPPRGITPQDVPDIEASEGEIFIPLRSPAGRLQLIVADDAVGPFPIHAEIAQADVAVAEADLVLQEDRFLRVEASGGEVTGLDGRVRARFPRESIPGAIWVRIRPATTDSAPPYSLSGPPFEILAEERRPGPPDLPVPPPSEGARASRSPIRQFGAPLTIEVAYREEDLDGDERSLIVFYYDKATGAWQPLPTQVDIENNIATAQTDHLSVFDINAQNLEASRLPDMAAFQTSHFTGAATYSYPLWVPPGPGGLQPELVLSYNSQTVDSATSVTQASWVGMGWDLSTGAIVRDTHGTIDYAGDDTFSFSAGGVSSLLLPGVDGYYHTTDESFWRIQHLTTPTDHWKAWDGSGNEYVFDDRAMYPECTPPSTVTNRPWRWSLTSVRNVFGQALTFTYAKETKTVSGFCGATSATMDLAVYPDKITYPHNRYRVLFVRTGDRLDYLSDWTLNAARNQYQRSRLTQVRVEQDSNGNGSFETLMRRYDLTYATQAAARVLPGTSWEYSCGASGCAVHNGALTLVRIQEFGVEGNSSLPAITFGYSGSHLAWGENGYGGRVEFAYESGGSPWNAGEGSDSETQKCQDLSFQGWSNGLCDSNTATGRFYPFAGYPTSENNTLVRVFNPGAAYRIRATVFGANGSTLQAGIDDGVSSQYLAPVTLLGDATPATIDGLITLSQAATQARLLLQGSSSDWSIAEYKITPLLTRNRVSSKTLFDGISAGQPFNYTYSGAASNDAAHSAAANEPEATRYTDPYSEFRGHSQVDETGPGGRLTRTLFLQADDTKGRSSQVQVRSQGASYPLSQTNATYESLEISAARNDPTLFPHKPDGGFYTDLKIWWTATRFQEIRSYEGNSTYAARQTEFQYLAADQNGLQFGNVTRSIESSWNGASWVPYRVSRTLYYPAASNATYLVRLPAAQESFPCPGGTCTFAQADLLAATLYLYDGRVLHDLPPTAGKLTAQRVRADGPGGPGQFSDATYAYDTWGNITTQTACTGYGIPGALASSGCQATSTQYDSTHHTFATQETRPLNLTTTWTYDYTLGAPIQETDPNGAVTTAAYDGLGRLTSLRRPGDTSGPATLAVSYFDTASPYWIEIRQRAAGSTNVLRSVYDGLGRRVQTQTAGAVLQEGTRDIIVDLTYNAYGEVTAQSVPYAVAIWSGSGNPYRTPDISQPKTQTAYDAAGRPVSVTATDGSQQTISYDDLQTISTDALGHATTTVLDVWGRTLQVIPPTGPSVSYLYDALDRLTTATMGGATTTISYDKAGRKLSMDDPDLGDWSYVYDALGNLTRQTDARGCTTDFTYDTLNRLTRKAYAGPGACGSTLPVIYSYDSGPSGLGRRTGMADASGSTSWTYDARGRVTSESKTILGAGTYLTAWGYDSADQVLWMRYPGGANGEPGENVSYTYHPQQTLNTVASDLGGQYVQSTSYDAAGRADLRALSGGAFQVDPNYFAWNTVNGQGRLQQIRSGPPATPASLQDLRYSYDAVGNVSTIEDYRAGPPQTQTFGYDTLDRLTSASVTGGTGGLYSETYTYNPTTGNLDTKGSIQYAYNDPAHVHGVTHLAGVERYRYDAMGNQTWRSFDGSTHDLTYDAESRLIEVRQGGSLIAEFLYDGNGELVREISGGQTTVYIGRHQEVVLGTTPAPTPTPTITPTLATATVTPTPTTTPASGEGLTGEYFHNADLTNLALVRTDPTVNFNWGSGSPAGNIGADTFSARWTGYVEPQYTATYTFHVRHDDGIRLWVNNQQLIAWWNPCGVCDSSGTIALTAGVKYPIRLEYYENTGGALVDLGWSTASLPRQIIPQSQLFTADPTPTPTVTATRTPAPTSTATRTPTPTSTNVTGGTGLTADYYDNSDFTNWKLTRTDATVNFAWGTGSPNASIGADTFSVRWTGYVQPQYSQTYTFYVNHDDGARLWVNNTLIVDQWGTTGAEHTGTISLSAGMKYSVRLEYFENTGSATVQLSWSSASQAKQIIPQARLYPAAPTPTPPPTTSPTATFTPTPTATAFSGIGISSIVSIYNGQTAGTINISHTVEPGPNRLLLLVTSHRRNNGQNATTHFFDGQAMTVAASRCDPGADTACASLYYLVNPPVGTYTAQVNFSSTVQLLVGVMTLYGVDQANPVVTSATASGTGTGASLNLTVQPDDWGIDVAAIASTTAANQGPGQTERWDQARSGTGWGLRGASSTEAATGASVTMSYSWNNSEFGYVAAAFRSAANAIATPTPSPSPTPTITPTVPSAPSGQIWRSYYFAGAQRIAVRVEGDPVPANNGVFYLLGDHLGSTSIVVDPNGNLVSELRYKAWGETRYSAGGTATDYRYNGQREEAGIGLYYYRARWYDPALGRFAQADTLIGNSGMSQAFDRYAYVLNNPLAYTDPRGHDRDCSPWDSQCKAMVRSEQTRPAVVGCGATPSGRFSVTCSLTDFVNMNIEERRDWLRKFTEVTGAGQWFYNVEGILTFFEDTGQASMPDNSNDFNASVDAYLLLAIQQGYALSAGVVEENNPGIVPAAAEWASFFSGLGEEVASDAILRARWSRAEIASTEYGARQTIASGVPAKSWNLLFLTLGHAYRWRMNITLVGGGPLGFILGDWASDPRSQFAGVSPVYWYSMIVWGAYNLSVK